jgi:hypothetical protein
MLREAYGHGSLVLFLGAGVSTPHGLPSWSDLISRFLFPEQKLDPSLGPALTKSPRFPDRFEDINPGFFRISSSALSAFLTEKYGFSPTVLARLIEEQERSTSSGYTGFLEAVRGHLYQDYHEERQANTLDAVTRLAAAGYSKNGMPEIVSFNYDDLVENKLCELGVPAYPIFDESPPNKAGIPVVHVHGFIPRIGVIPQHKLVFSEQDYHALANQHFDWRVSRIEHNLRTNTALFVGLSMSDPNLRRLLDATCGDGRSGIRHVLLRRDYNIPENATDQSALGNELEHRLGINPFLGTNFKGGSAETKDEAMKLFFKAFGAVANEVAKHFDAVSYGRILRLVRDYETRLFRGMGLEAVWVRNFDDIPLLLGMIAESG